MAWFLRRFIMPCSGTHYPTQKEISFNTARLESMKGDLFEAKQGVQTIHDDSKEVLKSIIKSCYEDKTYSNSDGSLDTSKIKEEHSDVLKFILKSKTLLKCYESVEQAIVRMLTTYESVTPKSVIAYNMRETVDQLQDRVNHFLISAQDLIKDETLYDIGIAALTVKHLSEPDVDELMEQHPQQQQQQQEEEDKDNLVNDIAKESLLSMAPQVPDTVASGPNNGIPPPPEQIIPKIILNSNEATVVL